MRAWATQKGGMDHGRVGDGGGLVIQMVRSERARGSEIDFTGKWIAEPHPRMVAKPKPRFPERRRPSG